MPPDRLVPLGMGDNFWEQGLVGPCGPCTEIHYGTGGLEQATEVWNLVFMEHERVAGGGLEPLPLRCVDTGMGLERLTALLAGESSVYSTDLFLPLLAKVRQVSGRPAYGGRFGSSAALDTAYRVLVDHARMVAVCLADGATPEKVPKVKTVLRRALKIAAEDFGSPGLLAELTPLVLEELGEHHGLESKLPGVLTLLRWEEEHWSKSLELERETRCRLEQEFPLLAAQVPPGQARAYLLSLRLVSKEAPALLSPSLAYRLHDSLGLGLEAITHLASLTGLAFSPDQFKEHQLEQRMLSKVTTAQGLVRSRRGGQGEELPPTGDGAKYEYRRGEGGQYTFPALDTLLLRVGGKGGEGLLGEGQEGALVTRETCFYSRQGGQEGDRGLVRGQGGGVFRVRDTQREGGVVRLLGEMEQGELREGEEVSLEVDPAWRLGCMRNHTATHLVNGVLHSLLPLTAQRSSYVCASHFKFDFSVYSSEFGLAEVARLEQEVSSLTSACLPVSRSTAPSSVLGQQGVVSLPGATYPPHLTLVTVPGLASEPCCGTHLLSTSDLGPMVVVALRTPGTGLRSLRCLTGLEAKAAMEEAERLCGEVARLGEKVELAEGGKDLLALARRMGELKARLQSQDIPLVRGATLLSSLDQQQTRLQASLRLLQARSAEEQMNQAVMEQEQQPWLVASLDLEQGTKFSLSKAAKQVKDRPALLLSVQGRKVKAKALVPSHLATETFTAERWLGEAAAAVGGELKPPRGQDGAVHCNMLEVVLGEEEVAGMLEKARRFAGLHYIGLHGKLSDQESHQ